MEQLQSQVATLTERNEKLENSFQQKEEQMGDLKKQVEALEDQVRVKPGLLCSSVYFQVFFGFGFCSLFV